MHGIFSIVSKTSVKIEQMRLRLLLLFFFLTCKHGLSVADYRREFGSLRGLPTSAAKWLLAEAQGKSVPVTGHGTAPFRQTLLLETASVLSVP